MILIPGKVVSMPRSAPSPLRRSSRSRSAAIAIALAVTGTSALLASCGSSDAGGTPGKVDVVASFYPLQWMAEQVGGDRVEVSSLTKPGAEPHDLELTPSDVGSVQEADVVAYLSGFQPAVDDAVADASGAEVFDAAEAVDLDLTFTPIEEGAQHDDEAGSTDPHFWLDPTLMAQAADEFADTLAKADPDHAAEYRANAKTLVGELDQLDGEMEAGLADCERKELVTSHNAFGYLARRYGLKQVGITGLTPEQEPSPKDLAAIADFVEQHGVTTIYFETLTSPSIAKTLAAETGADTAVLDPIEGLTKKSKGSDYLEVMASNLTSLQQGQGCS
jgi:zinc transport system substrate-binding protein